MTEVVILNMDELITDNMPTDGSRGILEKLNDKQREAVLCTEGPLLILAGAGSGKTRVLTHRIAYLIAEKKVKPWNICAITFTNKAADEMRERVDRIVGYGSESIWVATFHSSCVRILHRFADRIGYDTNFTIYDADDSKSLMKEVCKALQIDTGLLKEKTILNAISSAKDELINDVEYSNRAVYDFSLQKISAAYREYQSRLRNRNAMDFDDLIMNTVELFQSNPDVLLDYQKRFEYVCVDEYQDTNTAQFKLVELLSGGKRNLCVVGDDDQSIYKFRGANIRNILDFEKVYPEATVIRLEQNYRSTQNILDAANNVIANNKGRKEKSLWTESGTGALIHFRQFDMAPQESEYIARQIAAEKKKGRNFSDYAVLYRTNAQSRLIEERLVIEGIPYQIVGGINFYARREIKDVLSYLRVIDNGRDDLSVKRILNIPKRGIGNTTLARIDEYAQENGISFLDAVFDAKDIPSLGRAAGKVESFGLMIRAFRSKLEIYSLEDLLDDVIETIDYDTHLEDISESKEDLRSRKENIDELFSKVKAFEDERTDATLSAFLEEIALVADIDSVEEDQDRVLLMTVHGAKGLEFTHVFLAGMEDGIFPGYMSISSGSMEDIEEERRLCYVGITRAKEELTITCAKSRMLHGQPQYNPVSRFVSEIPPSLMDNRPVKRRDAYSDIFSGEDQLPFASYTRRSNEEYGNEDGGYNREKSKKSVFKIPYETPGTRTLPEAKPIPKPKKAVTPQRAKPYLSIANAAVQRSSLKSGVTTDYGSSSPGRSTSGNSSGGLGYEVGDRVKHIKFGEGYVRAMEPGPRDVKVTVDFDDCGQKIMYAAFAKLIRI